MLIKIKTWKQMEKEYELNESGNINCICHFTEEMEKLMPKDRIVEINKDFRWEERKRHIFQHNYIISKDMIDYMLNDKHTGFTIYGKYIDKKE